MLYIQLFWQFFQIGIFSFGGGYATMPFLYEIANKFHWYSTSELTNMLAVSSITPGPVGVNVATFAGFNSGGIFGSLLATTAVVLPSFIIVTIVSKTLEKFKTNQMVKGAVKSLKPAGCALLTSVGIKLLFTSNLHLFGTLLLVILIATSFIKKLDPLAYLGIAALAGLIIGHLNWIGV